METNEKPHIGDVVLINIPVRVVDLARQALLWSGWIKASLFICKIFFVY